MKSWITVVRRMVLIASLGGIAHWAEPASAQPNEAVSVKACSGKVEYFQQGTAHWQPVAIGTQLFPLDRVRTLTNSSASLLWFDSSVLRLDAMTELVITNTGAANRGLDLIHGILSFFHRGPPGRDQALGGGNFGGIKGTEFLMEVAENNGTPHTTLSVIDGTVEFGNAAGTLVLTNGQQAWAEPGRVPQRTAGFIANNLLQWCFYYPGVLDLNDLPLTAGEKTELAESLAAYRDGDLLGALARYPANRKPGSDAERIYYAALLLSVGQVEKCEAALTALTATDASGKNQRLATALRTLIAAVKHQPDRSTLNDWSLGNQTKADQFSTELLAASYYEQSKAGPKSLANALELARRAVTSSPDFGFGWERVAELEFSFGRTDRALKALNQSLALATNNAQALALKGFLLAAQNKTREAIPWFDRALAVDSALGNAWLGRGLCRIRRGDTKAGREDLLVAAAMEPQRAALRSYLGKAWGDAGDTHHATNELNLAKRLDPNDPTAWLYSALLNEQNNHFNEAVRDLEKSQELNHNRSVYRSGLLLDQDRAVRSANLARIYAEAGLEDVALREASRAVSADYANYSAHLFLANSYEQLRASSPFDLRFETPAFSEYLISSLLGPADGRLLAQPVSQQEYTRLFDRDSFGVSLDTEYLSRGAWSQYAAQYGTFGNSSYAVESDYHWDPGQTPNGSQESRQLSLKWKQMLTPKDGLFFQVLDFHQTSGDLAQRYDPRQAVYGLKVEEKQEPSFIIGYDHKWSESQHTLFLASRINDSFRQTNPVAPVFLLTEVFGSPDGFFSKDLSQDFSRHQTVDSFELQHLLAISQFQFIAGVRIQNVSDKIDSTQTLLPNSSPFFGNYFADSAPSVVARQRFGFHSFQASPYLYGYWKVASQLTLMGGVSYDYLNQPRNSLYAPLSDRQETKRELSPKAALIWTPFPHATIRAAYARSLGGYDLGQSVRLEPTQIGGFVTTYRNLIPSSIAGSVGGAQFETADGSLEYNFADRTYAALSVQLLRSHVTHDIGVFERDLFSGGVPPAVRQTSERLRFQERSLGFSLEQLIGNHLSAGIQYRISDDWFSRSYPEIKQLAVTYPAVNPALAATSATYRGLLQTVRLNLMFQHPCGFFAGAESIWRGQTLNDDLSGVQGDNFWQENLMAGYRFPHRHAELRAALLNVTDGNYHLHPINLYPDIARSRTVAVELKINF